MNILKRQHLIRIIEKMERNPEYSKKIEIKNISVFKPVNNSGEKEYIC